MLPSYVAQELKSDYPYLKNICFLTLNDWEVAILINTKTVDFLLQTEHRKGNLNETIAVKTSLG